VKKLAVMLMFTLIAVPAVFAQPEIVRFTENCELTVTFPGKVSTRLKKGTAKSPQEWMHVRDIDNLGKHYEISAECRPIDPRGREFELLTFYKNMEKEARRVQIENPHTGLKQDKKHGIILGEWKGYTNDYAKKPVTVEGRYILGRQSKLLLMVATPGTHPKPSAMIADFLKSVRRK
jgi:hypothetical protein